MKTRRLTPFLLSLALTLSCTAGAQEAESKAIGKIYTAVEAKLKESTHCHWEITHHEEEFVHKCDAWFSPEGTPLKVTDDITQLTERRLTEYVFDGKALVFVLQRKELFNETNTAVHEDRLYYANSRLFYHLGKEADFKSGAKLDVSNVKNTPQPVAKDDDSFTLRSKEAKQIVAGLQAGPLAESGGAAPLEAPVGEGKSGASGGKPTKIPEGPAKKYCNLIEESASPNKRYALGWGIIDPQKGPVAVDEDYVGNDARMNYIVDTKAGRIIAITAGEHNTSKAAENHWHHTAVWSPDSTLVIQMIESKWRTESAEAFLVTDGKATCLTDLLYDVRTAAETRLDRYGGPGWKKQRESFTFTIAEPKIAKDGTVTLETYHQIPKEDAGFTFKVAGKFNGAGRFEPSKLEQQKE